MKQKKIGDILYVFDDVPYYIQEDTDATTIYVQEEYLDGYQELNPALAFTPYNYRLLRVSKPEWADYINADDEPVEDEGYSPDAMDLNGRSFMMSSFPNGDIGIAIGIEEGASSSHSFNVDRSELEEQMQGIGASDDNEDDGLVGEYDSDFDPTEVRSEKSVPLVSKIIVTKQGYGQYSFKVALGESEHIDLLTIDYSDTESETASIIIDEQTNADVLVFGLMNKQEIVPEKGIAGIAFVSSSASIDLKDDSYAIFELINPNDLVDLTAYASDPSCAVQLNNNLVYVTPSTTGTYTVYVEFAGNDYYLPSIISATLTVADTSEPVDTRVSPELQFDQPSYSFDLYTDGSTGTISISNPHDVQNVSVTSDNPISMNVTEQSQEIEVTVTLAQGTFTITVSFAGDANYLPQTITTTLVVTDSTPAPQPIDYPVSLAESDIQVDNASTASDIQSTIVSNLSGYSPNSWGVWPYITIVDQGSGTTIVNNVEMYSQSLVTAIDNALANVSYGTTVWQVTYDIASTTYSGQEYNAFNDSCTFTFVQVQQDQDYGCSLLNNDIQFDINDVSDQDIEDAITGNLDGYDSSWMPEPTITVMYGSGDSDYVCQNVAMSQLDFSNEMSYAQVGGQWTVYYTIAADDYAGEHYAQQDLEFTISFIDSPTYEDYPVSLLNSTAEIEYEEGSSEVNYGMAVADALMGLLEDYDDSWMPTPTCTIYAPDPQDPNEQVAITEDTEIGGTTFGSDLQAAFQESGAIVADQTQWKVYITIPSSTYAGEDYQAWNSGEITLSFVSPAVEPLGHLRLTSNQNGSTVAMTQVTGDGNAATVSLDYTTDEGATWNQWDFSAITVNEGESICFRGTQDKTTNNKFVLTGNWSASGNIMSLLYGDNFEGATFDTSTSKTNKDAFRSLFKGCSALYDVTGIILPENTTDACYVYMFDGCSNIETAPYLPAAIHASDAYGMLFQNCTKIKYIKFNTSNTNQFYMWLNGINIYTRGIMVNENPDFNPSSFNRTTSGCPSSWTLLTSDPIDYPISINNNNPRVECTAAVISDGDTQPVLDALMGCIDDYDDTWMPAIQCTITDTPQGGAEVTYTNNTDLGGTQWTSDVNAALMESGAITQDETQWTCHIHIPAYTNAGQYYNAFDDTLYLSFIAEQA